MFRKEYHDVQVIHELKKFRNIYKYTEKKARQRNLAAKGICVTSGGGGCGAIYGASFRGIRTVKCLTMSW
jgi:hypothetical protein